MRRGTEERVLAALDEVLGDEPGATLARVAAMLLRSAARAAADGRIDDAEVLAAGAWRVVPEGHVWVDHAAPLDESEA